VKIIKTASGKSKIKISKKEWQGIGKKAGWMKEAMGEDAIYMSSIGELIREEDGGRDACHITIEPSKGETYSHDSLTMYFYGTYGISSVNEGMEKRVFLERFDNEEDARRAAEDIKRTFGIDVDISDSSRYVKQELPSSPPSWVDPADAGEVWSEDDY